MVYYSEYLSKIDRGKSVVKQLYQLQPTAGFQLSAIPLNKNEWCRDYMPVRASDDSLILFKYYPPYLAGTKTGSASIPNQVELCAAMNLDFEDSTDIILDGGAIDIHHDIGIISSLFLKLNGDLDTVKQKIQQKLKLDKLIAMPPDPWDFTGHVDGLVRFIDEKTVLINDYSQVEHTISKESKYIRNKYWNWKKQFDIALAEADFNVKTLSSSFHNNQTASSARGVYLNFLLLSNSIIMPSFDSMDNETTVAAKELETYYGKKVYQVEASLLADKGGIINCITWNI